MVTRVKVLDKHIVKKRIDKADLNITKSKPAASMKKAGKKTGLSLKKKAAADKKLVAKRVAKPVVLKAKKVKYKAKITAKAEIKPARKNNSRKAKSRVILPREKITVKKTRRASPVPKLKTRAHINIPKKPLINIPAKKPLLTKNRIKAPVKKLLRKEAVKKPRLILKKAPVLKKPVSRQKPVEVRRKVKITKAKTAIGQTQPSRPSKPENIVARVPEKPIAVPVIREPEKRHPDHWSTCGQLFFTAGKAYGLTDHGQTICVGSRTPVLEFLEGGKLERDLNKYQKEVLLKVKEKKSIAVVQAEKGPLVIAKKPLLASTRRNRTR
jgi:hypothetical protein